MSGSRRLGAALATLLAALLGTGCASLPRDRASFSHAALEAARPLLQQKERGIRADLLARHVAPEGWLIYRIDLGQLHESLQTGQYPINADAPSWGGMWTAASCLRYAEVEQVPAARDDADLGLRGLEHLMAVTSIRGLLARQSRPRPLPFADESGVWHAGRDAYAGYRWKGDVSVDQYANGLLPAVWECRNVFPERAKRLISDVAEHLLAHDMKLVDAGGTPTRYGNLGPWSGLGFNGIAILTGYAVFALAAHLAPEDPRWEQQRRVLAGALWRTRFTNAKLFRLTSHSNDLMSFNLYRVLVPLHRAMGDERNVARFLGGVRRVWSRTRAYGHSHHQLVACRIDAKLCSPEELSAATEQLLRFPRDRRAIYARERLRELPRYRGLTRGFQREARDVVPIEIRPLSSFAWKSSPYSLNYPEHDSPESEQSGADFLSAYWLWRAVLPLR